MHEGTNKTITTPPSAGNNVKTKFFYRRIFDNKLAMTSLLNYSTTCILLTVMTSGVLPVAWHFVAYLMLYLFVICFAVTNIILYADLSAKLCSYFRSEKSNINLIAT